MEQPVVCRTLEGLTLVLTLLCGHEKRIQNDDAEDAAHCALAALSMQSIPCAVCEEIARTELLNELTVRLYLGMRRDQWG
jgi:hypothetical protein